MVGSLKYFDLIYVMTGGGPGTSTELMATYMYKKAFTEFNMGYGSTIGLRHVCADYGSVACDYAYHQWKGGGLNGSQV